MLVLCNLFGVNLLAAGRIDSTSGDPGGVFNDLRCQVWDLEGEMLQADVPMVNLTIVKPDGKISGIISNYGRGFGP